MIVGVYVDSFWGFSIDVFLFVFSFIVRISWRIGVFIIFVLIIITYVGSFFEI